MAVSLTYKSVYDESPVSFDIRVEKNDLVSGMFLSEVDCFVKRIHEGHELLEFGFAIWKYEKYIVNIENIKR